MIKIKVVVLYGVGVVTFLVLLFITYQADQFLVNYVAQKAFNGSPNLSRLTPLPDVETTEWALHKPPAAFPICSYQEPYDLSFCIPTTENSSVETVEGKCHPEKELFPTRGNRCISYDMLQTMPDSVLSTARRPAIYSVYPQDIPLPTVLQAVKNNRPMAVAPINNPKLVLLRTSQSICPLTGNWSHARYDLIIIVKSSPANAARRSQLRQLISRQAATLASPVGLLFSLGVPADTVNQSRLLHAINDEAARFDDIILTDFMDTYYNLTLKTLANLRYAHVACQGAAPLVAFMDDDHGLNLSALLPYFRAFERRQLRQSVFGHIHGTPKVIRSPEHKWALTRGDMPFYMYPDYAAGPCYFIGAEAVEAISIAAAFTKPFSMEDAYVGMTATKLGIHMHQLPGVYLHGPREGLPSQQTPLVALLKYFEQHTP
ncbi:hypothetical protein AAHC03_019024 [Spirometra sp. Aus1]